MSTIFISYSSRDQSAADEMHRVLVKEWGYVDPFLSSDADSGILVGDDWMATLKGALRKCKALIFSVASIPPSPRGASPSSFRHTPVASSSRRW